MFTTVGRESNSTVDPRFRAVLACHILRRVFATVRGAQHGGMLILVPEQASHQLLTGGHHAGTMTPSPIGSRSR